MEQKTNEIRKDVGESTAELKTATNSADILVTDKSQKAVPHYLQCDSKATYAAFCSTVKFVISAAGTLAFILKKNERGHAVRGKVFQRGSAHKDLYMPFTSEVGQKYNVAQRGFG